MKYSAQLMKKYVYSLKRKSKILALEIDLCISQNSFNFLKLLILPEFIAFKLQYNINYLHLNFQTFVVFYFKYVVS